MLVGELRVVVDELGGHREVPRHPLGVLLAQGLQLVAGAAVRSAAVTSSGTNGSSWRDAHRAQLVGRDALLARSARLRTATVRRAAGRTLALAVARRGTASARRRAACVRLPLTIARRVRLPLTVTRRVRLPLTIARRIRLPLAIARRVRLPLAIARRVRLPLAIARRVRLPLTVARRVRLPLTIARRIRLPLTIAAVRLLTALVRLPLTIARRIRLPLTITRRVRLPLTVARRVRLRHHPLRYGFAHRRAAGTTSAHRRAADTTSLTVARRYGFALAVTLRVRLPLAVTLLVRLRSPALRRLRGRALHRCAVATRSRRSGRRATRGLPSLDPSAVPGFGQSRPLTRNGHPALGGHFTKEVRRCPTLPQGPPCSTIGAESLSFRVRNVTGRFPLAMAAETLLMFQSESNNHTTVMCCAVLDRTSRTT